MKNMLLRTLSLVMCLMLVFISSGITATAPEEVLGKAISTDEGASAAYSASRTIYNDFEWEVLAQTNYIRLTNGLNPLTTFSGIQSACDIRAEEITVLFDHVRPDGTMCFTALTECGVPYSTAGENIAAGQRDPDQVVDAWMNSPGHRANMLSSNFNHMGVGYLEKHTIYNHHWVQMFSSNYGEKTKSLSIEGPKYLFLKKGARISDLNLILHAENSVYGDCVCPLLDEMCTGYDPDKLGQQTVTARYDGKTVDFVVQVSENGAGVALDRYSAKISMNHTLQLNAELYPADVPVRGMEWKSSDESVATVDQTGLVTAVGPGKCNIIVKTEFGAEARCAVEVTVKKITSLKLDRTSYSVTLKNGDSLGGTFQLTAAIKPKKASMKTLKWKSSNKNVATVDENGLVTIVGFGKCTITAKTKDGSKKTASCTVTVNKKYVTKIKLAGENTMKTGDTQTIEATIKPKKAFDMSLKWKSSNPAVATVDENGTVTALKKGSVTITCTAKDGSKVKAKFKIKVTD